MKSDDNPLPEIDFLKGATLLVNKPAEWTSFDVVNKIRHRLRHTLNVKKIKVGHAGTLDPLATGLLIICTGKNTKLLADYQGLPKTYDGTIILGGSTPSYDAETEVDEVFPTDHITSDMIQQTAQSMTGPMDQIPPMFSAIKVDGQPLYKKARKGKVIEVKARPVIIERFDILSIDIPTVAFDVECSKGTYIRSLAHDFGKALDSGAYLGSLRRTSIGSYQLDDAWELDELVNFIDSQGTPEPLKG